MTLPNFDNSLTKYAELIVKKGANVQPGQTIVVYIAVDQVALAHKIVKAAYERGANEVLIDWQDSYIQKQFLNHTDVKRLATQPDFIKLRADELMAKHATRISVLSGAPDALKDVVPVLLACLYLWQLSLMFAGIYGGGLLGYSIFCRVRAGVFPRR